jgi:hypothetical protein
MMHFRSDAVQVMLRKRSDGDAYSDWGEFRILTDDLANSPAKRGLELSALQSPPDGIAGGIIEARWHMDAEVMLIKEHIVAHNCPPCLGDASASR